MVRERWPTDSIRSSSPLILASLLYNNFVLDIFWDRKKKGYMDSSISHMQDRLFYCIDRNKKMSVYMRGAREAWLLFRTLFLPFLCCATIHRTATREKLQSNQFWIVYFLTAARLQYYDPTYTRATCVTYIKCACEDKRVGSSDFLCM
jgi:hypothetical protein